jgi:hypothetical protein
MTRNAELTLIALSKLKERGLFATRRWLQGKGVPTELLVLARQLKAIQETEETK